MIPVWERMDTLRSFIVLCLAAWMYRVLSRERRVLDVLRFDPDPSFGPMALPVEVGVL